MALDVYFSNDIERTITGLAAMAVQGCVQQGTYGTEYISGALTMARSIAFSFGCDWGRILAAIRSEGYGWLLDQADTELLGRQCVQGEGGKGYSEHDLSLCQLVHQT